MRRKKRWIWLLVLLVLAAGAAYAYREYNRKNADPHTSKAKYKLSAKELLKEFETGDSAALHRKYDDKLVEVNGIIKEIKKDAESFAIMLGDSTDLSTVQCEMNSEDPGDAAQAVQGSSITIRGHFVGYQKGEMMMDIMLGSVLYLNRCIIVNKK